MLCILFFAKNTNVPFFLLFSLMTDLYFLIPAVIAQFFNHIAELVIPIAYEGKKQKQN